MRTQNGELLLSLCSQYNLSNANTFLQVRDTYKTTGTHPRSKHWQKLDFTCRQHDSLTFISLEQKRSECSTDHLLLRSKVNLQVNTKKMPQGKKSSSSNNVKLLYSSLRYIGHNMEVQPTPQTQKAELFTDNEAINKRLSEYTDPSVVEEIPVRPLHVET